MKKGTGFWLAVMVCGVGLLGRDGYRQLKGAVASELVAAAVSAHLADGASHRPWQWADFQPLARLTVPRLAVSLPVLTGSEGQTMAFGLAHMGGTAWPGQDDNIVLAGHRDSWARFMADLTTGDLLVLEFAGGQRSFRVQDTAVVAASASGVMRQDGIERLTLVTCYPFGSVWPSSRRFVVSALPVAGGRRPGVVSAVPNADVCLLQSRQRGGRR